MIKATRVICTSVAFCFCGLLTPLATSTAAEVKGDPAKLVGLKRCAMCHKKEESGDQYGTWQKLAHAKAFETLASDESKAVATKLGIDDPQTSGKCLKCHSTAYYFTEERQTEEVDLENGVTCQSCHGPGDDYKKKSIMQSREESIANGMIYPAKQQCTLCHNDSSPTWDPERYTTASGEKSGFDYDQAYEKIKHERPAK